MGGVTSSVVVGTPEGCLELGHVGEEALVQLLGDRGVLVGEQPGRDVLHHQRDASRSGWPGRVGAGGDDGLADAGGEPVEDPALPQLHRVAGEVAQGTHRPVRRGVEALDHERACRRRGSAPAGHRTPRRSAASRRRSLRPGSPRPNPSGFQVASVLPTAHAGSGPSAGQGDVALHRRDEVALDLAPGLVGHVATPVRRAGHVLPGQAPVRRAGADGSAGSRWPLRGRRRAPAPAGRRGRGRPRPAATRRARPRDGGPRPARGRRGRRGRPRAPGRRRAAGRRSSSPEARPRARRRWPAGRTRRRPSAPSGLPVRGRSHRSDHRTRARHRPARCTAHAPATPMSPCTTKSMVSRRRSASQSRTV